jgi:hypothetical protein
MVAGTASGYLLGCGAPLNATETVASNRAAAPVPCAGGIPYDLTGFDELDAMAYIERPDADATTATAPLEIEWLAKLAREEIQPPLSKHYCQMGVTRLVVDFIRPVEDDAVAAITQRALYRWVSDDMGTGWQIEAIGQKNHCARRASSEEPSCL